MDRLAGRVTVFKQPGHEFYRQYPELINMIYIKLV